MNNNRQCIILPLRNLSQGKHKFDFFVGNDFFEKIESSEIRGGSAELRIFADKSIDIVDIRLDFEGEAKVVCDRCLEEFMMPVEGRNHLSVRITDIVPEYDTEEINTEEDIMYIVGNETELDLTEYVYESIYLAFPIQRIHPDDKNGESLCNPEMLKYLSNNKNETDSPFADLVN